MILTRPFPKSTIEQFFGENAVPLYNGEGLKGHPGEDYVVAWGTPVHSAVDNAYCYSTINKDNPDWGKYRTPCFLVEDETGVYELIYGHASDILAVPGKTYNKGDIVSRVGNTGEVFVNGKEVTTAQKKTVSHPGSHLHFQVRLLTKVKKTTSGKQYVLDGNGLLKRDGWYYEVVNYNNGYNGTVDPEPYFAGETPTFSFQNDLYIGLTHPDVLQLQKWLNKHGFTVSTSGAGSPGKETNYFGPLTQNAVIRLQKAKKISPAAGFVFTKTRAFINANL